MLDVSTVLPPPITVHTKREAEAAIEALWDTPVIAYDTETTGTQRGIDTALFLALSDGKQRWCVGPEQLHLFCELMEDPEKLLVAHVANFDAWMLAKQGIHVYRTPGRRWCTATMHLLYDDTLPHNLDYVAWTLCGIHKRPFSQEFPEMKRGKFRGQPGKILMDAWKREPERVSHYASLDAYATYPVYERLKVLLAEEEIWDGYTVLDYFGKWELPFTDVLLEMEMTGIGVDLERLKKLTPQFQQEMYDIAKWFAHKSGQIIKPNNKAAREFFYSKLGRPPIKYTGKKQQPALDKETLQTWMNAGCVASEKMLRWRQLEKLCSTYLQNLYGMASKSPDKRIHTTFNQHVVRTGRLSCVSGATLLHTTRGSFRFDEYVPHAGDRVRTHTGALKPILRKVYKGVDKMFRVHLDSGAALECTADHRILTASGWTRVGDLAPGDNARTYDVSLEELYAKPGERAARPGNLLVRRPADAGGNGKAALHDISQCTVCGEHAPIRREGEGRAGFEVLPIQDGCCQPDAGKGGKKAPQLEGGVRRRQGIPNLSCGQEESVRAPSSVRENAGNRCRGSSRGIGGSPHQWGSEGQQAGQSGVGHGRRPSAHPHEGKTGTVVEITPLGTMGVWTIEVAEDHSYATHGFFSKNSSEPNLQNQPPEIRDTFIAGPGRRLLVFDYGQVEWRLAAHLSQDTRMLDDIYAGRDAHCSTAAAMFNVLYDDLMEAKAAENPTKVQLKLLKLRKFAKTLNFGILYGEGPMKLGQQLNVSFEEAKGMLRKFRDTYPELHAYFRRTINTARETERCLTLLGRPRRLNTINSDDRGLAAADERKAKNSPIQGSASDIIKAAMLLLVESPYFTSGRASLLLQVHDELVIEADEDLEHDEAFNKELEYIALYPLGLDKLSVPLTIDKAWGDNWLEGKG